MVKALLLASMIGLGLHFLGCSSSDQVATLNASQRFELAKTLFSDEDYLQAINELTIITLQYQGSSTADSAQFYLGECRYARGEYLLAGFEYQQLQRNYPASVLVADAQYKLGLSYYGLSPKSALDQQYTIKARDELQSFVEYYPSHGKAVEAETLIQELTTRLARKSYEIAEQYAVLEYYKSALFYYDDVIEKYHDTEYSPLAYLGKAQVLIARKKYADAENVIQSFLEKFPNSVLRRNAEKLKEIIGSELGKNPGVSGNKSVREPPGESFPVPSAREHR